ncbi:MAG: flagellar hook-basal body complex protein, partial [Deltaproteobacteria bacterium]|nr:flagellar hook-basal body complex protein [Deltaproteobacteria bacterium]
MSISAAMYAAVTGLSALSTGMQVISNNIANVNTVGFKAARTNFEDLISQDYWSNGKINQIGRGVKVSTVQQMFTQGSFMNSAQDTDMAITGEGFFQVRDRVTNELMYTRAGNFTFDADGYLETPAGYILQGWQLSVAKPGEDPVRLGAPTDIKVIAINAPPVETSQIKVVVNLNSEDEPAYLYSASAWATAYAHQIADGPAQIAKQDAIDAVYNVTIHGSAYPNTSTAFNNAYRTFMLQQGFVENPLGVFQKQVTESPTADEINDATSSAYASAMQLMGIVGTTYPIASNSPEYTKAFNDAYVAKMNGMGYQLSAGTTPVFKRVDAANQAYYDMAHINASAAAASDPDYFTGYTYGTYPDLDAIYINAYKAYMDSYGFTESTPGLPTYGNDPTPSEITAAETASADTTYTTPYQKHKAYNETLITLGYTVYPPFVDDGVTILDRTYFKPVTAAQLASSQAGAHNEGSAYAHAITNCPTDYTYPSGEAAYDNAYVAGYTSYMASQGFTGTQPAIPNYYKVSKAGTDEEDLALGEAQTAALLNLQPISNYPSTSNNPLYKILFDDKYKEYMTNLGYSTTVNSVPPYFQKTYMRSPDTGEDNAAKAAAIVMAEQEAEVAGQLAYTKTYDPIYQATLATITQKYAEWQLEGNGYAGAWDGTDLTSPIDPENYTHSNPWVIYDSLGAAHTLTVYYQPNPYEENVWDYIITCDPSEDARKDPTTGYVYMNGASFTGLIQKGKITFSAEGPDRHGGV